MAYGTSAGVTLLIGKVTEIMDASAITAAITKADIYVDQFNSSASAVMKTAASEVIAADILQNSQSIVDSRANASKSGTDGEPAITLKLRPIPSKEALTLLRAGVSSRNDTQVGS